MSEVILSSGGMDSFFVALLRPNVPHVYVNIGHKYHLKEQAAAWALADYFGVTLHEMQGAKIGPFEHMPSGIIPLRNAELILCAAQHGDEINMGILENEVNSDKSPEFLRAIEQVMNISCRPQYWSEGRTFNIRTPLGTSSKVDLLSQLWETVSADQDHPLWRACLNTVSCYAAGRNHCGQCPSCFKRWVGLTAATGIDHGFMFQNHPGQWRPRSYWREQGYASKRIQEIEFAHAIATR